jgi:hypothetical protein
MIENEVNFYIKTTEQAPSGRHFPWQASLEFPAGGDLRWRKTDKWINGKAP